MKEILLIGLIGLVLVVGCVSPESQTTVNDVMVKDTTPVMEKENESMEKSGDAMEKTDDVMVKDDTAMVKTVYVPFTQTAYQQAKADGKTIFLEFYANWCPTCKAQAPALEEGLSRITSENFAAFRVNYKDSETDSDEQALAQKFNITYQHTHIVTNGDEEVLLRSQENWSANDVEEKVGAFVN